MADGDYAIRHAIAVRSVTGRGPNVKYERRNHQGTSSAGLTRAAGVETRTKTALDN